MTRYEIGFMRKCAEYGVDGRELVASLRKRASMGHTISSFTPEVAGAIGTLNEGAKAGKKIPWLKILAALGLVGGTAGIAANSMKSNAPAPAPAIASAPVSGGSKVNLRKLLTLLGGTAAVGGVTAAVAQGAKSRDEEEEEKKKKRRV